MNPLMVVLYESINCVSIVSVKSCLLSVSSSTVSVSTVSVLTVSVSTVSVSTLSTNIDSFDSFTLDTYA